MGTTSAIKRRRTTKIADKSHRWTSSANVADNFGRRFCQFSTDGEFGQTTPVVRYSSLFITRPSASSNITISYVVTSPHPVVFRSIHFRFNNRLNTLNVIRVKHLGPYARRSRYVAERLRYLYGLDTNVRIFARLAKCTIWAAVFRRARIFLITFSVRGRTFAFPFARYQSYGRSTYCTSG